jgi:hypothetical protein
MGGDNPIRAPLHACCLPEMRRAQSEGAG